MPPGTPTMTQFARCFLLVFCQLGVGGLLALAVPPFVELERGFYKSSGGVFLSSALLGGAGTVYLGLTRPASGIGPAELVAWPIFLVLFGLYVSTLWGDAMVARARLYVAALLAGLLALTASTIAIATLKGAGGASWQVAVLGLLSVLTSAAALGSVATGMLIGHWYLIDPGMEIEPFRRCFRYFVVTVWLELAALGSVMLWTLALAPTNGTSLSGAASPNLGEHLILLALRIGLGPVAALAVAAMIRRVLAIPQTMAATGLFYIATLAILVGEFLGRFLLFRTGLPL